MAPVLAVSFRTLPTDATPEELALAAGPIRAAGAPAAHEQRLPAAVLAELAALSALLERLTPVPDEVAHALGLSRITQAGFHPFFHEIAEVEPADDPDEPVTLLAERWPGFLLGSLLVQRAGVRVRAGAAYADATVAVTSRLHWATRRPHRPTAVTPPYRRDHHTADALYYNVDAHPDQLRAGGGEPALTSCERLDLLRYRCVLSRADLADTAWAWAGHLRYCESRRYSVVR